MFKFHAMDTNEQKVLGDIFWWNVALEEVSFLLPRPSSYAGPRDGMDNILFLYNNILEALDGAHGSILPPCSRGENVWIKLESK